MTKFILKRRTFDVSPYNHNVHVIFTTDVCRAAFKLKDELGEDITARVKDNMGAITTCSSGNSNVHVFLEKQPNIGTIVHELYHAVDFILHDSGVKNNPEVNNETWAYHLGELTRQVVKFYHQVNARKSALDKRKKVCNTKKVNRQR